MKKLHNQPVQVTLTDNELWTMLKLFRDGEFSEISPELEQKFILGYHAANLQAQKAKIANQYQESTPDIEDMLQISEDFESAETAVNLAWDDYLRRIAEASEIKHYEPLPYPVFAQVLKVFIKDLHEPLVASTSPAQKCLLSINKTDWDGEDFNKSLEEMREYCAGLLAEEQQEHTVPLNYRINAAKLSIRCIEYISAGLALKQAPQAPETSPSNIIELEPSPWAIYIEIRKHILNMCQEFKEDFEHLKEVNELELPIGDTFQEGKLRGVEAVLDMLTAIEAKYK